MDEGFGGGYARLAATEVLHGFMMFAINLFSVVMLKQCGTFLVAHRGDIYIPGGVEALCLCPTVYLIKIQVKPFTGGEVRPHGQHRGNLVIRMSIQRPVRKDYVRSFFRDQPRE